MPRAAGPRGRFPPEVVIHVVRLACERPDARGRRLSQWDGAELAHQRIADGLVEDISAATVRRILAAHPLKPWRHHVWLHPKPPRGAAFSATIAELIDLYTRPLEDDEMVLSVDEKTSRQPRPRPTPTLPAQPHHRPNRHEHEDKRAGALNRLAAFDTRSGHVYGHCVERKRQQACIAFLEHWHREMAAHIRAIHLVCDNPECAQYHYDDHRPGGDNIQVGAGALLRLQDSTLTASVGGGVVTVSGNLTLTAPSVTAEDSRIIAQATDFTNSVCIGPVCSAGYRFRRFY